MTRITKSINKKQKARISITDITNQYFRKLLREFNNSPCIAYKIKQVHNEPTEADLFLLNQIYKPIQRNKHTRLYIKKIKSNFDGIKRVNVTIGHVNKIIQCGIASLNRRELEIINVTIRCDKEANKNKEYSIMYGNKSEENTSSTSEKKKIRDGYVRMYECGKNFFCLTYERVCAEQDMTISKMK